MDVKHWQSGRDPIVMDFTSPFSIADSVAYDRKLQGSLNSKLVKSFVTSEIVNSSANTGM